MITADGFLDLVQTECVLARAEHAPMTSLHEAHSIIMEEFEEFWDEIKKKHSAQDATKIIRELIQVAAMTCCAVVDLQTQEEDFLKAFEMIRIEMEGKLRNLETST